MQHGTNQIQQVVDRFFFEIDDVRFISDNLYDIFSLLQESEAYQSRTTIEKSNLIFTLRKLGKLANQLSEFQT